MDKAILVMTAEYIAMKTWDNSVRFLEASIEEFPKEYRPIVQVAAGKVREAIRLLQPVLNELLGQADAQKVTVLKLIKNVSEREQDGENPDGN